MKDKQTITVIIPCYNAASTIEFALHSLENQTYKNFKVLLIDDGSTDNSLQVIKDYKRLSAIPIDIITKNNGGVSAARNVALDNCDTEWIAFLDADDEYHPQFLEILFSSVSEYNVDTAACRYEFTSTLNNAFKRIHDPKQTRKSKYDLIEIYTHRRIEKVNFWGFLYKKSILDYFNIRFAEDIKFGEDTLFLCQYLKHCNNGGLFIDENLYEYYVNSDSATHTLTYNIVQNIEAHKRCVSYWKDDKNFDLEWGEYIVARAIWAAEKTFAQYSKEYFLKLQSEMNVKKAMQYMSKHGDEKSIRMSATAFLINPMLFYWLVHIYTNKKH